VRVNDAANKCHCNGTIKGMLLQKKKQQRMVSVAGLPEIEVEPTFGVRCRFKIQSKITVYVAE